MDGGVWEEKEKMQGVVLYALSCEIVLFAL
jgi:hypothetical protein